MFLPYTARRAECGVWVALGVCEFVETPEQVERHQTLHRGRGTVKDVYMYTWLPTCQMWPPSYLHNTTLLCLLTPPQTLPCSPDDSAATALTTVMSTWTMNVLRGSERAKLEKSDITSCDYVSQV